MIKGQLAEIPDNWDCLQSVLWSQQLPAATIEEFISRTAPLLIIIPTDDGFRLADNASGSRFDFETLEQAKASGDGIAAAVLARRAENMPTSAGLDPDKWTFRYVDRFVWFEKRSAPQAKLERYGPTQWVVELAGKRIGIARSAAEGAEMVVRFVQ